MPLSESLLQSFMNNLNSNAHILDVCSGTDSVKVIQQFITSGFRVTAIDFSEKTVQLFRNMRNRWIDDLYIHKVQFCVQDIRHLGIQPQSVDAVSAIYALDYFDLIEYGSILHVLWNVLKPQGFFLLSFSFRPLSEKIDFVVKRALILNDLHKVGFKLLSLTSIQSSTYHWLLTQKSS